MLKTLLSILLWAVLIALMVVVITTVYRLTLIALSHSGLEEKAEGWGKRLAQKKAQFEERLEEQAELL